MSMRKDALSPKSQKDTIDIWVDLDLNPSSPKKIARAHLTGFGCVYGHYVFHVGKPPGKEQIGQPQPDEVEMLVNSLECLFCFLTLLGFMTCL